MENTVILPELSLPQAELLANLLAMVGGNIYREDAEFLESVIREGIAEVMTSPAPIFAVEPMVTESVETDPETGITSFTTKRVIEVQAGPSQPADFTSVRGLEKPPNTAPFVAAAVKNGPEIVARAADEMTISTADMAKAIARPGPTKFVFEEPGAKVGDLDTSGPLGHIAAAMNAALNHKHRPDFHPRLPSEDFEEMAAIAKRMAERPSLETWAPTMELRHRWRSDGHSSALQQKWTRAGLAEWRVVPAVDVNGNEL